MEQFQNYLDFCCRRQKNASHTVSINRNYKISNFLTNFFFVFVLYDTPTLQPKQEKKFFENSMTPL